MSEFINHCSLIEMRQICKKLIPFEILSSHNKILLSRLVDGERVAELADEDEEGNLDRNSLENMDISMV